MKKLKLLTMLACMALLAVGCGKDNDNGSGGGNNGGGTSGTIKEVATFDDLNAFFDRNDIEALKTELRNAGYTLTEDDGKHLTAEKRNTAKSTAYIFDIESGMIVSSAFYYGEGGMSSDKLKSTILEKVNEEKTFSAGKELKRYHGHIFNDIDDQHSFTSREEFISWFTNATLSSDVEGVSECTYGTYETTVDIFPDQWGISIDLK